MAEDVWRRLDRRVRTARGRAEEVPDEHGLRAGRNIAEMIALRRLLTEMIEGEVVRGREDGAGWSQLGTSKQQAQQTYRRVTERRNRVNRH